MGIGRAHFTPPKPLSTTAKTSILEDNERKGLVIQEFNGCNPPPLTFDVV
jgi:hypothetical protein